MQYLHRKGLYAYKLRNFAQINIRDMNWSRLFLLFFVLNPLYSIADTYPEVVFDNSLSKGSYARSKVSYSGDSWVENVKMQLLVSDTLFYTPGNALSLKYNSSATGNWEANIQYSRQKYNYQYNNADYLNLRIYVKTKNTSLADLRLINHLFFILFIYIPPISICTRFCSFI